MTGIQCCNLGDVGAYQRLCAALEPSLGTIRLGRFDLRNEEAVLESGAQGTKVFWLFEGEGEVLLSEGHRTKEGDGHPLPPEYEPQPMSQAFSSALEFIEARLNTLRPGARAALVDTLGRRRGPAYVGDCANDLWKLEHTPQPWTDAPPVNEKIQTIFERYRDEGFSVKTSSSYERIITGDQLVVGAGESLRVRGRFACVTAEHLAPGPRHVPAVARLRYLRDTSGGCNTDFDPFRRLPLTWYVREPGEIGDGINFVNSHVVNIPKETSPTHFHPKTPRNGGLAQHEIYVVLDPKAYELNTYGRRAAITVFPDLLDLSRFEEHPLKPGDFVHIPPGIAHRGLDVFVNVLTVPGFKPHNEFYIDRDILESTDGHAPYNAELCHIKNYDRLADLL